MLRLLLILLACPLPEVSHIRAYVLMGECNVGCHAGLWVTGRCAVTKGDIESWRTFHRLIYVFDERTPRLDEWAKATNSASHWIAAWRQENRT